MRGSTGTRVGAGIADVTFFFDPLCPWTWRAARWLTTVADLRDLDVEWRSFSLELLHDDEHEAVPPPLEVSTRSLRLVEALAADGRHQDAGRFYLALGRRVHEEHADLDLDTIKAAADEAGVGDAIGALDDAGGTMRSWRRTRRPSSPPVPTSARRWSPSPMLRAWTARPDPRHGSRTRRRRADLGRDDRAPPQPELLRDQARTTVGRLSPRDRSGARCADGRTCRVDELEQRQGQLLRVGDGAASTGLRTCAVSS